MRLSSGDSWLSWSAPGVAPVARYPGKGSSLVRTGDRNDPSRVFQFMSTNQVLFPIATMARVLGVSTAGYYAWRSRPPSARSISDATRAVSRGAYGAPRVYAESTLAAFSGFAGWSIRSRALPQR